MDGGLVRGNSVDFRLPTPPPSMNSVYQVIFAQRRVELKPEVRAYKTAAKMYVPRFEVEKGEKVGMRMTVAQDWYFKNGAMKKQDVQNMAKVLVDVVAERMGFDDSQVWEFSMVKEQETVKTGVQVKVWRICGETSGSE